MGAILASLKARLSSVELLAHTPCGSGPTPGGLTIIVCTSATRPGSPATGQVIYETDTDSLLVWNGSAWIVFGDEQLLWLDTANGRIGINDTTPSYALDVTGDIRATGTIYADGTIVFEGATPDANETTLTVIDPTADQTISLPNASGNVALTSSTTGVITLGTDTAGNYVAGNTAGYGIAVTGTPGEGWSPTISTSLVGAKAYRSNNVAILNNTFTDAVWNAQEYDTHAFFAPASTNITIPAGLAGYYLIQGSAEFAVSAVGSRFAGIQVGGVNHTYTFIPGLGVFNQVVNVSAIMNLAVGNVVTLEVYQNSGGNLNLVGTALPSRSWLAVTFLGT
jgi:hypothetical protein